MHNVYKLYYNYELLHHATILQCYKCKILLNTSFMKLNMAKSGSRSYIFTTDEFGVLKLALQIYILDATGAKPAPPLSPSRYGANCPFSSILMTCPLLDS